MIILLVVVGQIKHCENVSTCNNNLDVRLTASPDIGELLDELDVVDPIKFPPYVEFPWLEGEAKVTKPM